MSYITDGSRFFQGEGMMRLFHGSRKGIKGQVSLFWPGISDLPDFGKAFYLGTNPWQPKALVCEDPDARFYKMNLDLSGLSCLSLNGISWILQIARCRKRFPEKDYPGVIETLEQMFTNIDVVIGPIADDRLFVAFSEFFNDRMTDVALWSVLDCFKLETQYALKTERAVARLKIVSGHGIALDVREGLILASRNMQRKKDAEYRRIVRENLRNGMFFSEILERCDNDPYAATTCHL